MQGKLAAIGARATTGLEGGRPSLGSPLPVLWYSLDAVAAQPFCHLPQFRVKAHRRVDRSPRVCRLPLSRPADARRTASRMIERDVMSTTPLHVELLVRYAMNGFRLEEVDRAIPAVERARLHQVLGSAADACLQIALGEMQRIRGAPERAVVHLTEAYRATSNPGMRQQHVLATEKLARAMDWAGDHLQAISRSRRLSSGIGHEAGR